MRIDELPEEVKESVLDKNRLINIEHVEWWDSVYDDVKTCGEKIGIDIEKIYFSGFSNQGDGACFEGSYDYRKGSVKEIKEHAPQDETLIEIAENLQKLQRRFFYQLGAHVAHQGHYMHEMCTTIDVYGNEDFSWEVHYDAEDGIIEFLRDFMRWIYSRLTAEYDYLTSDEAVEDTLRINEYNFNLEGEEL